MNTHLNIQEKIDQPIAAEIGPQTTKPTTTIVDTAPILSRRKKRRISAGW